MQDCFLVSYSCGSKVRKKLFPNGMFLDWTQDAELAGDLQKVIVRI